jgi:hypothetical protein
MMGTSSQFTMFMPGDRVFNFNNEIMTFGIVVRPGVVDGWCLVRREDNQEERLWAEFDMCHARFWVR